MFSEKYFACLVPELKSWGIAMNGRQLGGRCGWGWVSFGLTSPIFIIYSPFPSSSLLPSCLPCSCGMNGAESLAEEFYLLNFSLSDFKNTCLFLHSLHPLSFLSKNPLPAYSVFPPGTHTLVFFFFILFHFLLLLLMVKEVFFSWCG